MGYIMRTPWGPICTVCQSPLGWEEDDWDECDTCGGEGIGSGDSYPDETDEYEPCSVCDGVGVSSNEPQGCTNCWGTGGVPVARPSPSLSDERRGN